MAIIVMMHPPCWDLRNQHSTARTPLPFSFSFSLFFFPFFSFFVFLLSFCRSPCLIPCSFFVRFCPFVLSFSVWYLYRLLRFYFRFPAFLGDGFCYSVVSSRRYTPPRSLRAWSMRIPLAFCLLSSFSRWWCWLIFTFFFSSFHFSISSWTSFVFILYFSCGYCAVSSVSVSAATRLAYDMYLNTYVRWSHLFIFVWGIRFVSVVVCVIFCFFLFSSWGNFPLQNYWSLSCDDGLHCSDELIWEQQQRTNHARDTTAVPLSMLIV